MTLKDINRAIQKTAPLVTLYKGQGYLYYIFDDVARNVHESHSVYVPYLYMLDASVWISDAIEFSKKTEAEIAERGQFGGRFRCVGAFTPLTSTRA